MSRAQLPTVAGLAVWGIAAAVLGFAAVRLLEVGECDRARHDDDRPLEWSSLTRRRRLGGIAILALGGLYALLATLMIVLHVPEAAATWTWLFGVLATVTGTLLLSPGAWRPRWPRAPRRWLEVGLRMAAAIEGVLSVIMLYLLVRRLWGARPALLTAALLAISAWDIHFSRTGS